MKIPCYIAILLLFCIFDRVLQVGFMGVSVDFRFCVVLWPVSKTILLEEFLAMTKGEKPRLGFELGSDTQV